MPTLLFHFANGGTIPWIAGRYDGGTPHSDQGDRDCFLTHSYVDPRIAGVRHPLYEQSSLGPFFVRRMRAFRRVSRPMHQRGSSPPHRLKPPIVGVAAALNAYR